MDRELEKKYFNLIVELKILAIQTKDRRKAKEYITLCRQLQKIREGRHLDLIGEEGEYKKRYNEVLEFVDRNYSTEKGCEGAKKICEQLFSHIKDMGERE